MLSIMRTKNVDSKLCLCFQRHRQTPCSHKKVKAHGINREHQLLLLTASCKIWRFYESKM